MGTPKKPWGLEWRSNTVFIVFTVGIGMFTDLFLYGLIVPILPYILEDRIHVEKPKIQTYTSLLLAIYAAASVLASLPAGIIADRMSSRQMPFLCGLIALFGATIMLFLGKTVMVLVVARTLQGISAAVLWTVGLALLMDTVGSKNLGVTIGSIFGVISVGELAAPVLGGIIYDKTGYVGLSGISGAVLAVDFIMRLLVIEKKIAITYSGGTIDAQVQQIVGADDEEVDDEAHEESPLLDQRIKDAERWKISKDQPNWIKKLPILYILGDSRILIAEAVAFTQATLLAVSDATIPTEAQKLFNFESLKSGLLFVPLILPCLIMGPIFGRIIDRTGPKPAAVIGMAFMAPCLILLRIPQAGGTAEIIKFSVILMFCGIGMSLIGSPPIIEASYVTEQYHKHNEDFFGEAGPYAQLYAINSMVFCAGLTIGPLVAGALRESIGYGNMNACFAGLCAVVSVLSFVYFGGTPKMLRKS